MPRIHYSSCPACGSTSILSKLQVKDYTVSGEIFEIYECADCTIRFTQDIPDVNEIGSYYQSSTYISHTDTREGLINSIYHSVRKFTLGQKQSLISKALKMKKGRLLDIGSGTGAFAKHMALAGWQVTGLEPDLETRDRALKINNQKLFPADDLFQIADSSVDAITMWHVLEHVHSLHDYIRQIANILTKGGMAFIAVPNYTSSDAAHYGAWWAAYDVPRHLYHFSPRSMETLLNLHQLKMVATRPMWFDSFYVSMLSETYKNGTPKNVAAFLEGLKSNILALSRTNKCSSLIYLVQKAQRSATD